MVISLPVSDEEPDRVSNCYFSSARSEWDPFCRGSFRRDQPPDSSHETAAVQPCGIGCDQIRILAFAQPIGISWPDRDLHDPIHIRAVVPEPHPEPAIGADLHIHESVWTGCIAVDLIRKEALRR